MLGDSRMTVSSESLFTSMVIGLLVFIVLAAGFNVKPRVLMPGTTTSNVRGAWCASRGRFLIINERARYQGIDVLAWSWSRPTPHWMMKALANYVSVPLSSRIVNRVVGIALPVMVLLDADVVALWRSRLALMSRAASLSSERIAPSPICPVSVSVPRHPPIGAKSFKLPLWDNFVLSHPAH